MKKFVPLFIVLGVIILVVLLYFVFFTKSASEETVDTPTNTSGTSVATDVPKAEQAASAGYYIDYENYQSVPGMYNDGKIVYFFNAKWCPTCKALTTDIIENGNDIPAGVTIVSVDYDDYTELKQKYGVTYQHTLVQVDADGNQIKKWSGGNTLDSVLQEI